MPQHSDPQKGYGKDIISNNNIVFISEWFTNKRTRRIGRYKEKIIKSISQEPGKNNSIARDKGESFPTFSYSRDLFFNIGMRGESFVHVLDKIEPLVLNERKIQMYRF